MPEQGIQLLAKEALEAAVPLVKTVYQNQGYSSVDKRVWTQDVPESSPEPWSVFEIADDTHSQYEDKESPVEVVFLGIDHFATEAGATRPYMAALEIAKAVTTEMTGDSLSVDGHTIYDIRQQLNEPLSLTGSEQTNIYGFGQQYEIHIE